MWGIIQKDSIDRLIQKVRNLTTRVEDLEAGGGTSITLAGDVTGDSSFNTVVQIGNLPIVGSPSNNGEILIYDNNDINLIWGVTPYSNIEVLTDNANIADTTQLVVMDMTGITSVIDIVLPPIRKHMQMITIKVIGTGSIGVVNVKAGDAANGFDPEPLMATVTELQNNSAGTIINLVGDLTNKCWWKTNVTFV